MSLRPASSATTRAGGKGGRIHSAAPVVDTSLQRRSQSSLEGSISKYSFRKNREVAGVLERVSALIEAPPPPSSDLDIEAISKNLRALNFDFSRFRVTASGEQRQEDGAPAKQQRANAADGSSGPVAPAQRRFHGVALSKLQQLRHDDASRATFFKDIDTSEAERRALALERGENIVLRNRAAAGNTSPRRSPPRVASPLLDERIVEVKQRKRAIMDERRAHFLEMVERTRGIGFVMEDTEMSPQKRKQVRNELWAPLLVHALFLGALQREVRYCREHREEILARQRQAMFAGNVLAIQAVQKWWRRVRWHILIGRRRRAVAMALNFIRGIDRVKVHFALAMHRMIGVVRKIQTKFRAVKIMREQRRVMGCHLVMKYVHAELRRLDEVIARAKAEEQKQLLQMRSAIKARKPLFEAKAKSAETKAHEGAKSKAIYRALSMQTVRGLVEDIIADREAEYNEMLLQYGRQLFDKFQAEVNATKLSERKMAQYNQLVRRKSVAELRVHRDSDKNLYRYKKVRRPFMRLALTPDEAREVFECDALAAATEDFMKLTSSHYGSGSTRTAPAASAASAPTLAPSPSIAMEESVVLLDGSMVDSDR